MVQNLMGFENICMMHTHHVATDFQLFLLAPFVVLMLWLYKRKATLLMIAAGGVATLGKFVNLYVSGKSVFMTVGGRLVWKIFWEKQGCVENLFETSSSSRAIKDDFLFTSVTSSSGRFRLVKQFTLEYY
jgi:hypothetical protein